jgi:hypothetical protein
MKNKLLLLIFGLIITTQMIYSQIPSYVPTSGLVGYWPFNGNANDQSGNGNNGTVNGATLTTDRNGNANSAYSFNGISDNISIPDSNSLSNMTSITISAWFNINQWDMVNNQGWFPILSKTNSSSYGKYRLGANTSISGQQPSFYGTLSTDEGIISQNNLYALNQWNQVVITISNGNSTISLNGVQVFNGATTYTGWTTIDNLPLLIGKDIPGIVDYANGKIDDIGIWNRALTQQEITAMYNGVNYSDTCNAVSGSLVNGLVAYYPFCGNANDQTGNGNNGLVNEATLTTDRFGNANSAYSFDGVNDFISCLNNNIPMANSSRTFSAWFYLTPTSGYSDGYSLISYGTNSFPDGRLNDVNINQNGIWYNAHQYYASSSSSVNNTNSWNNLVVTYDNTNISNIKIYFNGLLIPTTNNNIGNVSILNTLNTNVQFGKAINQYASYFYFNGKIDDIGIWNRALTQQEITQLYNQNQCITNITVTDTLIINVGQLSHTNPVAYANNITIYPNPASTQVNISFNNITDLTGGTIKVVNSLGQQVATTAITLSGTNTIMPLNTWGGTGLYFVQILNAQGIVVDVKKIILQ